MSTKGMMVTAARRLIEALSVHGCTVFALHDFDKSGLGHPEHDAGEQPPVHLRDRNECGSRLGRNARAITPDPTRASSQKLHELSL